jgi:RNA polymerase sigma-70 factor (ECF subfamily)
MLKHHLAETHRLIARQAEEGPLNHTRQSHPRSRSDKTQGKPTDALAAAIGELSEANMLRLTHVALRVLRHREDSEDALQDGLLSAFTHLDQFRGQSKFSTWLHSIVVNAALVKLRKQKARPTASLDEMTASGGDMCRAMLIADKGPSSEERFARREQFHILAQAIETLPKTHRSAVRLCNIEGLTTAEAARKLGISVPALKTRLFRARWLISNHINLTYHHVRRRRRLAATTHARSLLDCSKNAFGRPDTGAFQCAAD